MNTPLPTIQAFDLPTFCRLYGIGRTFAYSEIKTGRLKVAKAGKRTLIPAAAAREWFDSLPGMTAEA